MEPVGDPPPDVEEVRFGYCATIVRDTPSLITTYSGRVIDPWNIRPTDIEIVDIIHALPLICRFNGHCNEFYSVAQHSVLVASLLFERHNYDWANAEARAAVQWGLLHDALEIYVSDVPGPLRQRLGVDELETRIQRAVACRFALPYPPPESLALADKTALAIEWRTLRTSIPLPESLAGLGGDASGIVALNPEQASREFARWLTLAGVI